VELAPGASSPTASQISCPRCSREADPALPFCGHCGARIASRVSVEAPAQTAVFSAARQQGPRLALLDDEGEVERTFNLDEGEAVIGRAEADIKFPYDVYMSPLHARLESREGGLWLRDLGSRNRSWVFLDGPWRLTDGDVMLVGSQLLRFRRLGYPGPHPPEADSTRRMGSLIPSADVALLEQIRADSSVRDSFHLSPGRPVVIGRESGDWVFPYDQTMSGRHAELRTEDTEFFVHDIGSRNGVAIAVRGDQQLREGQRILVGDQILRVESL
jgi:predicted component of type VI protein secretion system